MYLLGFYAFIFFIGQLEIWQVRGACSKHWPRVESNPRPLPRTQLFMGKTRGIWLLLPPLVSASITIGKTVSVWFKLSLTLWFPRMICDIFNCYCTLIGLLFGCYGKPVSVSTHRIRILLSLVRGGDDSQVLDHLLGVFGLPRSGLTSGWQSGGEEDERRKTL